MHLRVSLLQFALNLVLLRVFVVIDSPAMLEHDVKLDGLLHVENESPDSARLDLGGLTSEPNKEHLEQLRDSLEA